MTSMFLTERRGRSAAGTAPDAPSLKAVGGPSGPPPLLFFGAVTQRDSLFLGVRGCRLLDHRTHHRLIGLDPIGDQVPFLSVPLLEFDRAASFVVHAGELEGLKKAEGAQLLHPFLVDIEVLQSPSHLLSGQRLLAELRLRGADRLTVQDSVDDSP